METICASGLNWNVKPNVSSAVFVNSNVLCPYEKLRTSFWSVAVTGPLGEISRTKGWPPLSWCRYVPVTCPSDETEVIVRTVRAPPGQSPAHFPTTGCMVAIRSSYAVEFIAVTMPPVDVAVMAPFASTIHHRPEQSAPPAAQLNAISP